MWCHCFTVVVLQLTVVGVERAGGSVQLFGHLSLATSPQDSNHDPAVQRYYAKAELRDVWLVNSPDTASTTLAPNPSSAPQGPSTPLSPSTATTRLKPPLTSQLPASTAEPSHRSSGTVAPPPTTPLPPYTGSLPTSTPTTVTTSTAHTMSPFHTETTSQTSFGPSSIPPTTSTSTVPSHSPEPSQDLNFQLILYTVPPLGFVVVVVIALFLVLCVHRYRKHRRYRHHLQMPLEEMDDSSEDGSDEEVNEEESQEAAFVVTHGKPPQPVLAFEET